MPRTRRSSTSGILRWEEPPVAARPNRRSKWLPLLDELREHPGEFAVLTEDAPSAQLVTLINKGRLGDIHEGEFEATSRSNGDADEDSKGTFTIYARYLG